MYRERSVWISGLVVHDDGSADGACAEKGRYEERSKTASVPPLHVSMSHRRHDPGLE
jgi:hypothetical protein